MSSRSGKKEHRGLSGLFGRRNKGERGQRDAPTTGQAMEKLRDTEDMLQKKQEYLEKKIEAETATAKKHAKTNKTLAMQALKRKKRYESQLAQLGGTMTTIETQRNTLSDAQSNTAVLQTMTVAAKALKKAHQDMDVDKVHDMMDDIAEQQDVAREISDAIANPVAFGGFEYDEDDLEAEFEALETEVDEDEQKELDRELLKVGPSVTNNLPEVPTADPVAAGSARVAAKPKKQEEDDMAALAAWAS